MGGDREGGERGAGARGGGGGGAVNGLPVQRPKRHACASCHIRQCACPRAALEPSPTGAVHGLWCSLGAAPKAWGYSCTRRRCHPTTLSSYSHAGAGQSTKLHRAPVAQACPVRWPTHLLRLLPFQA
jgi:hypothetical protein